MALLRNRHFSLLLVSRLLSQVGDSLFFPALIWFIQQKTGSSAALALTGVGLTLPAVFGALIGVYVDRWNQLRTMVACDIVRFCLISGLLWFVSGHTSFNQLTVIVVLITANQLFGQLFAIASNSFLPSIVPEAHLPEANGLLSMVGQGSMLLGLGLGGVLLDLFDPRVLFGVNAVSFALSAALLVLIRQQAAVLRPATRPNFFVEFVGGLRFIWLHVLLRYSLLFVFLVNLVFAPFEILLTKWANTVVQSGASVFGLYLTALSLGTLLGGLCIRPLVRRLGVHKLMAASCLGQGSAFVLFTLITPVWFGVSALLLFGVCNAWVMAAFTSWLQMSTPAHLRGRVGGTLQTLMMAGQPVGMAMSGVASNSMEIRSLFVVMALLTLTCCAGIALVHVPLRQRIMQKYQGQAGVAMGEG